MSKVIRSLALPGGSLIELLSNCVFPDIEIAILLARDSNPAFEAVAQ